MIFRENRLLADDSHEITYLIFSENYVGKMLQNLSSAAFVIGALRINSMPPKSSFRGIKILHNGSSRTMVN